MNSDAFQNHLSADDRLLCSKIKDMVKLCEDNYISKYSFFLDERQCELALELLKFLKYDNYALFGGYELSKRKILGVFPPYYEHDNNEFPVTAVKLTYRKADKLLHKDFLGALMSYQIKREILGDIIVGEGSSTVFIYNTAVDMIMNEVTKIGSVGVKSEVLKEVQIEHKDEFSEITGTVSSLRLDCITSLVTKQSREKSVLYIKSVGADINYKKVFSPDTQLKAGDIFSIRGFGKFILFSIGGVTKKNRIHVCIKKYI
ncbi:MAG TPA: YlmH/Sll1252 family protein [Oscillospiraceae bacterium]|nr:YlmH/Sll1252 family protein [Oscillospiraceae bacterium]